LLREVVPLGVHALVHQLVKVGGEPHQLGIHFRTAHPGRTTHRRMENFKPGHG
jgi:hypothetical protein